VRWRPAPYCRFDLAPPLADRFVLELAAFGRGPTLLRMLFGVCLAADTLCSEARRVVADADRLRQAKGGHNLVRQSCEVRIPTRPALADPKAIRHPLLTSATVAFDHSSVIAGALIIRQIATASVFPVGAPERLMVRARAARSEI
jgi:hypothetical protein